MKKFECQEILDTLNNETNQEELKEIYKALIAYNCNIDFVTSKIDDLLNRAFDFYLKNDEIFNFVDDRIVDYFNENF